MYAHCRLESPVVLRRTHRRVDGTTGGVSNWLVGLRLPGSGVLLVPLKKEKTVSLTRAGAIVNQARCALEWLLLVELMVVRRELLLMVLVVFRREHVTAVVVVVAVESEQGLGACKQGAPPSMLIVVCALCCCYCC